MEFEDSRDADDAVYELNGKDLCGERVIVEHARGPRRDRDGYSYSSRSEYGPFCGGLPGRGPGGAALGSVCVRVPGRRWERWRRFVAAPRCTRVPRRNKRGYKRSGFGCEIGAVF